MPLYQYAAMDDKGKERKGQKEAANEEAVGMFLNGRIGFLQQKARTNRAVSKQHVAEKLPHYSAETTACSLKKKLNALCSTSTTHAGRRYGP